MKMIKGPALFLAQFAGDEPPFNSLDSIAKWAGSLGFKGIQMPSWDKRLFDLERAAEDLDYCKEVTDTLGKYGLELTELATHLQGQLVAVHPVYDEMFDGFAPEHLHGNPDARQAWAVDQLKLAAKASKNFGLKNVASFSGALLWPFVYPWPQRPAGLVETGFAELAKRWKPILDVYEEHDVNVCYELHPGEDLHDGATFERFLKEVDNHPRANILYDPSHFILQQLDYLAFIDRYHERIKMFHVKDAEFNPTAQQGTYGGYEGWVERAGRFRSLGDGQVDFKQIFSKLTQYDFDGWAVIEWECCMKHPEAGAEEGSRFVSEHIIRITDKAFDDFAGGEADEASNRRILGLGGK
ncbi:sugar phosphate isomerase/epimerase family protein [Gilvimarinus xylanilyticus]|uniref:Sugar phosphate isomerase/epimerase n=1 Tax=Gilvimarinus xylanilyticus TaxID=2944139 RepID=A0A9X2HVL9_9GAMM|nr:sugar phosphate isomerase/epimerase [Gilvimarinus xylanilyticus]MCP8897849.1 sugar phosphate isomerase/epimerase [Gilvimarinus xylanilyticus]